MPSTHDPEAIGPLAAKLRRLAILKFNLDDDAETFPATKIADACSRLYEEDRISTIRAHGGDVEAATQEIRSQKPLLNRSYVSDLLHGKRDNPTKDVLDYLGRFFGVSPAYFFNEAEATPETKAAADEVEVLNALRALKREKPGSVPLLTAVMRGASDVPQESLVGMLHMQLAAMEQVKERKAPG
ncbi:helix-turn-helix domain-containing protein [Streptomyces albidoflavus]|uniref:helix-turn-helix domain-containing protein n=1 Tax=Streptomyces albidoflavus TaxID=1886 RepID=UPI0033F3BBEE